jgi:hypothetical protein
MKTTVTIPDSVFLSAEKLALCLGLSRSELYAKALEDYVNTHEPKSITEQLDEIYAKELAEISPKLGAQTAWSDDKG